MFDNCLAPHTKGDGTGCDNMTAIIVRFKPNYTGAVSRKRAVSPGSDETNATESDYKKAKTSATTESNGCASTSSDEKEATGKTVASNDSSLSMDNNDNAASSST